MRILESAIRKRSGELDSRVLVHLLGPNDDEGGRCGVNRRQHERVGCRIPVVIHYGRRDRVPALIDRNEAEACTGAIGDDLAVARLDLPPIRVRVRKSRIVEKRGQRDRLPFEHRPVRAE
jgi:hypothetical protein